jgi:hypothetical protein
MATIIKRDGSEVPVRNKEPVPNQSIKKTALQVIADHAVITNWQETVIGNGEIHLKLECIIDRDSLRAAK